MLLVIPQDLCWNIGARQDRSQTVNVPFRGLLHLHDTVFRSYIHLHCKHPHHHKSIQLHKSI